jgi:hypothetical protein
METKMTELGNAGERVITLRRLRTCLTLKA